MSPAELDLVFSRLKGLDSQNQTIIILLQQLRQEVKDVKKTKQTGIARVRQRLNETRDQVTVLKLQIKQLKKDNKELHGFLEKETQDIKFK